MFTENSFRQQQANKHPESTRNKKSKLVMHLVYPVWRSDMLKPNANYHENAID